MRQDLRKQKDCVRSEVFFFVVVVVVVCSDRNSGRPDVHRRTLEVVHRAVDLVPHQCVSRPSVCSQVLVIPRVLQEVFHCHG